MNIPCNFFNIWLFVNLYIPTYNSANFLKNLSVDTRFNVVVVDNCSQDETLSIAESKGWQVVKQKNHCSRTKNWEFAACHFLESKASWAKWLFTGDFLFPDTYDTLINAIESYPQAKLIVSEYYIAKDTTKHLWTQFPNSKLIMPKEALELASLRGNWFGAPIGQAFHRDSLSKGFNFGRWHWVADMQFFLSMAKHSPTLYLKKPIGVFNVSARKVFSKEQNALTSSVEEFLIRKQAADEWLALTDDQISHQKIQEHIVKDTEKQILERSINRAYSNQNFLQALKYKMLSKLI